MGRQGKRMVIGVGRISLAGEVSCRFGKEEGGLRLSRCRRTGMSKNALHRQRRKAHTTSMPLRALVMSFCTHMCLVNRLVSLMLGVRRQGKKEHTHVGRRSRQRVVLNSIKIKMKSTHKTHVKENQHKHIHTHPMIYSSNSGTLRER